MTVITLEVLLIVFIKVLEASGVPSKLVQCKCPFWCDKDHGTICLSCYLTIKEEKCFLYQHLPTKSIVLKNEEDFFIEEGLYCAVVLKVSELNNNNVMSVKVKTDGTDKITGESLRMNFTKDLSTNSVLNCHNVATPCVGYTSDAAAHAGRTWPNCKQECDNGTFGQNCTKQCHCKGEVVCNKTTGRCPSDCLRGWTGDDCQTEAKDEELSAKLRKIPQKDELKLGVFKPQKECTKCTHACEVKEGVASCKCSPGFMLSGPVQCVDIDECELHDDICMKHTCVNTDGSYMCECRHGYHNISLQTCVEVNRFDPDKLDVKKRSIFDLKSIGILIVAIGLSTFVSGFLGATMVLCVKTVCDSLYRFATTEPIEGITVRGTLHHYVIVTKYVEKCKLDSEEEKSIQQGVLSAKDSISPNESDIPLNSTDGSAIPLNSFKGSDIPFNSINGSDIPLISINGSVSRGSFIPKSAKSTRSGSHLSSKACSADPSKIKMQ